MVKSTDAWMPLYVADYLGDTGRLTTEQHGAYFLLMMDYWREGPPPDDDAVLAQITKLDLKGWKRARPILERKFQVAGGEWRHKRIDAELARSGGLVDQRRAAGKASAEARAAKRKGNERSNENGNERSTVVATKAPTEGQRNGRPSPSPSTKKERDDDLSIDHVTAGARGAAPEPPTDAFELSALAAEACRAGGVANSSTGQLAKNVGLIREWQTAGADPPLILETIRAVVADATEPIHSLAYFGPAVRQAVAKKEGTHNGHVARPPASAQRNGRRPAGDGFSAAVGADLAELGQRRRAAPDQAGTRHDPAADAGGDGLRLIAARAR